MKAIKRSNNRAQTTIELALILPIIFAILFFGIKKFVDIYKASEKNVAFYNKAIKESRNLSVEWVYEGEKLSYNIRRFELPGPNWFDPKGPLLNPIIGEITDAYLDKLKLQANQNWLKSGEYSAIDAFVKSGFNPKEIPWGFAFGVVDSGDVHNLLTGGIGSIAGTGVQGSMAGFFTSHGDWDAALKTGLTDAWGTEALQGGLADTLQGKDLLISSTNGAITGAISGGKDGVLGGIAEGALSSKTIQGELSDLTGGKDYLINATNVAAQGVLTGNTDAILGNMAQAALYSGSIQKEIFGEDPNSIIKTVGNSTASGTISAVQTGDLDQLYIGAASGAAREVIGATVKELYPDSSDPAKIQEHMQSEEFVSALGAQAVVMIVDKDFAASYAELLANQMIVEKAQEKVAELQGEATDQDQPQKGDEGSKKKDAPKKEERKPSPSNEMIKPADTEAGLYLDRLDLAAAARLSEYEEPILVAFNEYGNSGGTVASDAVALTLNASRKKTAKKSFEKSAVRTSSQKEGSDRPVIKKKGMTEDQIYAAAMSYIEAIPAEEVMMGRLYREIESSKPLAKKILRRELKRTIYNLNAQILSGFGYMEKETERLLGADFDRALEKALSHPVVKKAINKVVDDALNPQRIRDTVKRLQKRIVSERAFLAELELRKILWRSQRKGSLYSKEKSKNIVIEFFEEIRGGEGSGG